MSRYRAGQIVDLLCYWDKAGAREKTWNRGTIVRVAGVNDHLYRAKLPDGWYVVELFNRLHFDGPCMLVAQDDDLREVSPLQLLAEV